MSQILNLEIPDPLFDALRRQATVDGTDPQTVATTALRERFQTPSGAADDVAATNTFRKLFGVIDLGQPTGLANETIDADLINEYARR